ncbi:MAG: threonine/serine exporter family protein [Intestinibacter sp.]|uniref:threonine/serine exporter family protein n=1 Tax=Intestinibacter sp. TaxID=1965304 RepID=UPI003F153465
MSFFDLITNFIFSFVATVGFSIFFNAPKKSLIPCGVIGGIGWSTYIVLSKLTKVPLFSMVVASAVISLSSEILARKLKYPAISFIIPGILPLVPGIGLYNTMYSLVQKNYVEAVATGTDTLLKSGGIAIGILIITSLTKTYYILLAKIKIRKYKQNMNTDKV